MAKKTIRAKAKAKDGSVGVKALLKHPMEVGRDGKEGHYITEVKAMLGDRLVFSGYLGPAVSKNPFLKFSFQGGAKGDKLDMDWVDNTGDSDSASIAIK